MLIHVFHVERPVGFLEGGPSWRDNAGRTTGILVFHLNCLMPPYTYVHNMHIRWHKCTIQCLRCCSQKVHQASRGQPCLPSNSPAPRGDLHFVGCQWRLRVPSSFRDRRIAAMAGLLSWIARSGVRSGSQTLRVLKWVSGLFCAISTLIWAFLCWERGYNKHTYSCIHQLFRAYFSLSLSIALGFVKHIQALHKALHT